MEAKQSVRDHLQSLVFSENCDDPPRTLRRYCSHSLPLLRACQVLGAADNSFVVSLGSLTRQELLLPLLHRGEMETRVDK